MKVSQARVSESISTKGEERSRRFDIRLVLCHQQGCNPPGNMGIVESIIWKILVKIGRWHFERAYLTKSSRLEKDITLPKRGCSFVRTCAYNR